MKTNMFLHVMPFSLAEYDAIVSDILMSVSFSFQDSELNELRATIEALKRNSGLSIQDPLSNGGTAGRRHTTPGMLGGKDLNHSHGRGFHTLPMPTGKFLLLCCCFSFYHSTFFTFSLFLIHPLGCVVFKPAFRAFIWFGYGLMSQ